MDAWGKVDLLGEAAQFDICRGCGTATSRVRDAIGRWIYPAIRPDGKRIAMLKVLQSSVCEKDCAYCANRNGRDTPRTTFKPDELAGLFGELVHRRQVQGLFLSSGVAGGTVRATERMLDTVEIVRQRLQFKGYIHLKLMPGADDAAIEASLRLADRVSINLEAPNARRIGALSSTKDFRGELLTPLLRADALRRKLGLRVSLTTQFVVGAAAESDSELLHSAAWLYHELDLARAYYSAFQPVRATPLEGHPPTSPVREHRLYQADFLLRQYGFGLGELVFDGQGDLPTQCDPKLAWAQRHPERFPVELNTAPRPILLRIPGIGPKGADCIMQRRRQGGLRDLRDLGLPTQSARSAAPYVLLSGRQPEHQLALW